MKKIFLFTVALLATSLAKSQEIADNDCLALHFPTNVFTLTTIQKDSLQAFILAHNNKDAQSLSFLIQAYTDERGGVAFNQLLSEKRAQSVRQVFQTLSAAHAELVCETKGLGIDTVQTDDVAQRRVDVCVYKPLKCFVTEQKNECLDLSDPRWFRNLIFYKDAASMLAYKMYALDTDDNVLKTGGMVSFELTEAARQNPDFGQREVSVRMGLGRREVFDPEMKLWASVRNADGEVRWIRIPGRVEYDAKTHSYVGYFKSSDLPGGWRDGINGLNFDCCVRCPSFEGSMAGDGPSKVVYFSTFKDYGFTDVSVSHGKFSALIERDGQKVYAFVVPRTQLAVAEFSGVFTRNGQKLHFKAAFEDCEFAMWRNDAEYHQHKKSHYFIGTKEYNRKGFFAWVGRLFDKGDRY